MTLPFLLVRDGRNVVPVLAGLSDDGELAGYDPVGDQLLRYEPSDVVGAVNVDPSAVYFGLQLEWAEQEQRMAAEESPLSQRRGSITGKQEWYLRQLGNEAFAHRVDSGIDVHHLSTLSMTEASAAIGRLVDLKKRGWPRESQEDRTEPATIPEPRPHKTERTGPVSNAKFAARFLAEIEGDKGDDYRDYVDDKRVSNIESALVELGITGVGRILGSGSFGTAAILDDETIVKLTSDPTEVQAGYLVSGHSLRHVAKVEQSAFIRGVRVKTTLLGADEPEDRIRKSYQAGILLVERLHTLDDRTSMAQGLSGTVHEVKQDQSAYPHQLARLSQAAQRERLKRTAKAMALDLRDRGEMLRAEDRPDDADLAEQVAEAIDELAQQGIYAIDAHSGNVGYKETASGGRTYKLFDIGTSSPPQRPHAPVVPEVEPKTLKRQRPTGPEQLAFPGMLSEAPPVPWVGEGQDELEGAPAGAYEAQEAARRARPSYGDKGYLFAPLPGPTVTHGAPIVSGFPEVRPTLLKHRNELPSLETIQLSTIFAGATVRTNILTAERAFLCIADVFRAHGRQRLPEIDEIRECMRPLGLHDKRAATYQESVAWAPSVLEAMKSGLRDRELRRHLYFNSKLPGGISLSKLSFILALLGQDLVCLDGRLLGRMFDEKENRQLVHSFDREPNETSLGDYEAVEEAFLANNPFYRPSDPIGRARSQWMSWESVGGKPATHSTWLNVVTGG